MLKLHRTLINVFNKLFTNLYKFLGFLILTVILIGIGCYFAINAFYLSSSSWMAPVILSPSHERVVHLNSTLAQQMYLRNKLEAERAELRSNLITSEHALTALRAFQNKYTSSLQLELRAKKKELDDLDALFKQYQKVKHNIEQTTESYQDFKKEKLADEYEARLIDKYTFVHGAYLLSQIEHSKLTREEMEFQWRTQREVLVREIQALESALQYVQKNESIAPDVDIINYHVLVMDRQFQETLLETMRLEALNENMLLQISMIDESIDRYDRILAEIKGSPYLRAMDERVTIAFVPYENLENIRPGKTVYGCKLGLIWCEQVGRAGRVLDGEVSTQHPLYGDVMRGLMVELELENQKWAEEKVLFVGRAPLLF